MSKYRKKPVVIEAVQFYGSNGSECAVWCGGHFNANPKPSDPSDVAYEILIPTLEGTMTANLNDWIIKGVKGEFYPCKPDIFAETYEDAENE